ncbi:MAG: hypothetical protein HY901_37005, partial [Deltaproteobacteria bacterium]|nr:hypothetical protein [Deltaproteobacteria bacterium]
MPIRLPPCLLVLALLGCGDPTPGSPAPDAEASDSGSNKPDATWIPSDAGSPADAAVPGPDAAAGVDAAGPSAWAQVLASPQTDDALAISIVPEGGIVVAGYSGSDALVARLRDDGELLW